MAAGNVSALGMFRFANAVAKTTDAAWGSTRYAFVISSINAARLVHC